MKEGGSFAERFLETHIGLNRLKIQFNALPLRFNGKAVLPIFKR
jgi:hypothetical protein